MGILNAAIVQPILYAAYAVYVLLGIGAIVVGSIFSARAGRTNIGMAILVVGAFMLILGGLALFATYSSNWLVLFIVEIINVVLLIVLFVLSVQLMILGTGRSDPITDSVRESWDTIRPDLESSGYCDANGGDTCDEYYYKFKSRTDFTDDYYCPGISEDEEAFYSSNCTQYNLLGSELAGCTKLEIKCQLCDEECLEAFITDTQAYMAPVAIIIWALFLFLSAEIVWNNIIMESSGDDFSVEGISAMVSHALNAVVFLLGFLVMVLGLVSIALINSSCPEGQSCIGWTSTALVFFGALIFICAVLVSVAIWKDIQILLKIVDDILIILCFFLMLCAIPISMTAGILTGVSDFYESNYHTVRAELESYDASYCSYPATCDKKEALKETCGAQGNAKCCETCDEKWQAFSNPSDSNKDACSANDESKKRCTENAFFRSTQVEINKVIDISDSDALAKFDFEPADETWISQCEGEEIDIVCGMAMESLVDTCAFGVQIGDDDRYIGEDFYSSFFPETAFTADKIASNAYFGMLEQGTAAGYECLYESNSVDIEVYGSVNSDCEDATVYNVNSKLDTIYYPGTADANDYRLIAGRTRGVMIPSSNCKDVSWSFSTASNAVTNCRDAAEAGPCDGLEDSDLAGDCADPADPSTYLQELQHYESLGNCDMTLCKLSYCPDAGVEAFGKSSFSYTDHKPQTFANGYSGGPGGFGACHTTPDSSSVPGLQTGMTGYTPLNDYKYMEDGFLEEGTGNYAMVCGDSNRLKISGGWQHTANMHAATLVDEATTRVNGVCVFADDAGDGENCKNFFTDNLDSDSSLVGKCLEDVTAKYFNKEAGTDAGQSGPDGCDWLCQIKGGKCDDEDRKATGISKSMGSCTADDVKYMWDDNTWKFDSSCTPDKTFALYDDMQGFLKFTGSYSDTTAEINNGYGSMTQYECEVANKKTWTTMEEICEKLTPEAGKTGDFKWIEDTCTRVGLCQPTCVQKKRSDGSKNYFPWVEVDTSNDDADDDDDFYTVAGCTKNNPGDIPECAKDCEDYGTCVTPSKVDTDHDEYDDLGVCVWCSDKSNSDHTCPSSAAQLSLRGVFDYQPLKRFTSWGKCQVFTGDDTIDKTSQYLCIAAASDCVDGESRTNGVGLPGTTGVSTTIDACAPSSYTHTSYQCEVACNDASDDTTTCSMAVASGDQCIISGDSAQNQDVTLSMDQVTNGASAFVSHESLVIPLNQDDSSLTDCGDGKCFDDKGVCGTWDDQEHLQFSYAAACDTTCDEVDCASSGGSFGYSSDSEDGVCYTGFENTAGGGAICDVYKVDMETDSDVPFEFYYDNNNDNVFSIHSSSKYGSYTDAVDAGLSADSRCTRDEFTDFKDNCKKIDADEAAFQLDLTIFDKVKAADEYHKEALKYLIIPKAYVNMYSRVWPNSLKTSKQNLFGTSSGQVVSPSAFKFSHELPAELRFLKTDDTYYHCECGARDTALACAKDNLPVQCYSAQVHPTGTVDPRTDISFTSLHSVSIERSGDCVNEDSTGASTPLGFVSLDKLCSSTMELDPKPCQFMTTGGGGGECAAASAYCKEVADDTGYKNSKKCVNRKASDDYQAQVGTAASADYQAQVGTAASDDYQAQVGTPGSADYKPQVGTAPSVDYQAQVGKAASADYQAQVGTPASADYKAEVGTPASADYQAQVGTAPSADYKAQVGTPASVDYQAQVGTAASDDYKAQVGIDPVNARDEDDHLLVNLGDISGFSSDYVMELGEIHKICIQYYREDEQDACTAANLVSCGDTYNEEKVEVPLADATTSSNFNDKGDYNICCPASTKQKEAFSTQKQCAAASDGYINSGPCSKPDPTFEGFRPLSVTERKTVDGMTSATSDLDGCDDYVQCALKVGYTVGSSENDAERSETVFPTTAIKCDEFLATNGFAVLSPNANKGWNVDVKSTFGLENYQLASCDAELGYQSNSNVFTNTRYSDELPSSHTRDDNDNLYGTSMQTQEIEVATALLRDYLAAQFNKGEKDFTKIDAVLQEGVDTSCTLADSNACTLTPEGKVSSIWMTKARAVISEYWSSIRYCNALPYLVRNMKQNLIDFGLNTLDDIEISLDMADEYIVNNPDFSEILANRTQLDSDFNHNGNAAELLGKCALALNSHSDYTEDGEDSVCGDLNAVVDKTPSNSISTDDKLLDFCQACANVDFIDYDAANTKECLSFLLLQYGFGTEIYTNGESNSGDCCYAICSSESNRETLSDAGVNVCKMTDEDCKSKVKRYIEKNASPIGIVVFIEVIFMYVVVYLTQKAIGIFKAGDDDDDDDEDDDDE